MPPGAVTKLHCGRGAALAVLLAACAGAPATYEPGDLSPAQRELCKKVERAYRGQDPEYGRIRDGAVADPVVAAWLARMFVVDLIHQREGRPLGADEDLLRAAARIDNPAEVRAIAEIVALGGRAVPVLVGDLLQHAQPQPRELGVELLARIGGAAVPALREVLANGQPKARRAAARAIGAIGVDAVSLALLRRMALDGDYALRADALRALRSGGPPACDLLLDRLRNDDDAFVRRVAAQALAQFRSRAVAEALIDHLERCKHDGDVQGELGAQQSLQALAGTRGMRTVDAWRMFARDIAADGGAHERP